MRERRTSGTRRKAATAGILRGYETDNGPLTEQQMDEIRKLVPQRGFASSRKRLV